MSKIQRVSKFFRVFFQLLFVLLPFFLIYGWTHIPEASTLMGGVGYRNDFEVSLMSGIVQMDVIPRAYKNLILHPLSFSEKLWGFVASVVPLIVNLFIVYSLIKLFRLYERSEIFSLNNVKYMRHIGYGLLLGQIIQPFYQVVMGFILTMNNPPGHRMATITLDQTNVGILLTALLVILISWIMTEGCKLREEQQLTV